MKTPISLFWFRRDLRLDDNVGLFHALKSKHKVLPIFIFDEEILEKLPKQDARVSFIHEQLCLINSKLNANGSSIAIYHGQPLTIFKDMLSNYQIKEVYTNHDYEPYAIKRDKDVKALLEENKIAFKTYKDHVIYERNQIIKTDSTPYKVYTPYAKKWLECFKKDDLGNYASEKLLNRFLNETKLPFLSLNEIGFSKSLQKIASYDISDFLIKNYNTTRDFPSKNGTSKLGTHLRFGTVSIRKLVKKAAEHHDITFLKELVWREFFMQILWHFPNTATNSFKPKYDRIVWRNNTAEFNLWCQGKTGYPLVDAGMRELNETGLMHNRVRMVVGSFLCKHLLIDWRWGEAYFAKKLHDYEMSSNIGNWQWVAGCGVDAAPYFRIFNPTTQIKKFDENLDYIKKWVPEFQEISYSQPMVDHKFARERCLKTYKEALQ